MACLFVLFAGMFPRLADIFIWIARPTQFMNAFNDKIIWPILGIIFLPFTTLMYVILWSPVIGLTTGDWFWLIMAVLIDVMHYSSTAYSNRKSIPGYSGS